MKIETDSGFGDTPEAKAFYDTFFQEVQKAYIKETTVSQAPKAEFKPYIPQAGEKFMIQLKDDNSWRAATWLCQEVHSRFIIADTVDARFARVKNHKLFLDRTTFYPIEAPKAKKDPTKGMTKIRSVMAVTAAGELINLATFEDPITGLRLTIKKGLEVEAEPIKEPELGEIVDGLCMDIIRVKGTAEYAAREARSANDASRRLGYKVDAHEHAIIRLDKATKSTLWSTLRDAFVSAGALAVIIHLAIRLFS